MSGIVGYVGGVEAAPLLLEGLRRMQYRGADAAGLATLGERPVQTHLRRAHGRVNALADVLKAVPTEGRVGLGHTRWATHGGPKVENAHPHHVDGITVVHDGFFENADQIRSDLRGIGRTFSSETDSEVVAHLVALQPDTLPIALRLREALQHFEGSWAIGLLDERSPGCLAFARRGTPLILGRGSDGFFVASDAAALGIGATEFLVLEDGDCGMVTRGSVEIIDRTGASVMRPWRRVQPQATTLDRDPHAPHLRREIDEQPRVLCDTIFRAFNDDDQLVMTGLSAVHLSRARRVVLVGCGSSHHAALIVAPSIEAAASVDVRVELASEWRPRGLVAEGTLVVGISQSGETADTLGALEEARRSGADVAAITNVAGSAITRMCERSGGSWITPAGPELAVVSTKSFVAQIVALRLLGLAMASARRQMRSPLVRQDALALLGVSASLAVHAHDEDRLRVVAERVADARSMLYLGRGPGHPLALEGALKMTQLSSLHAQGVAAGEMKHGAIALIEKGTPVVALVPRGPLKARILSSVAAARARGAFVVAIGEQGDDDVAGLASEVITVAAGGDDVAMALKMAVPLQLLAYFVALRRGLDADMPRHQAKSMTVE